MVSLLVYLAVTCHGGTFTGPSPLQFSTITGEVLYWIGAALRQGHPDPPVRLPQRIIITSHWLFLIPVIAVISGNLIAQISVKHKPPGLNSLQDVLDHPTYEVGVPGGGATQAIFEVCVLICVIDLFISVLQIRCIVFILSLQETGI